MRLTEAISRGFTLVFPPLALATAIVRRGCAILALAVAVLPIALLLASTLPRARRDPVVVAATMLVVVEVGLLAYFKAGG